MNIEDFREVAKHLEPSAWAAGDGLEPYAVSMAVSAKRQADALERIANTICGDAENTGLLGYLDIFVGAALFDKDRFQVVERIVCLRGVRVRA